MNTCAERSVQHSAFCTKTSLEVACYYVSSLFPFSSPFPLSSAFPLSSPFPLFSLFLFPSLSTFPRLSRFLRRFRYSRRFRFPHRFRFSRRFTVCLLRTIESDQCLKSERIVRDMQLPVAALLLVSSKKTSEGNLEAACSVRSVHTQHFAS